MPAETPQVPDLVAPTISYTPYWVAVVIDGVVYDVLNVDGQAAARFLSQPTFVQFNIGEAGIGWTWDGTSFSQPPVSE